jgi:putative ABC transport system ATP-binding protein
VFQSFNLIPVLSALENVMLPLEIQGKAPSEARDAALSQMTELGLGDFAHQRPNKLSGGQQQRVALARSLITNPSLVVADEPTANLDSGNAGRIIEMMQELNLKKGVTFLFSTHDQRLLEHVQRRILLQDGAIAEDSGAPGS